jgi:hypothetical protein
MMKSRVDIRVSATTNIAPAQPGAWGGEEWISPN